jgi:hypothetical protein
MFGGGPEPAPAEPEPKPPEPYVLTQNDPPETPAGEAEPSAVTQTPTEPAPSSSAPAAAPPPAAAPVAAQPAPAQPQVNPDTTVSTEPLLVGATVSIVWRGQLDPGGDLAIEGDTVSSGEISRGLPGVPVEIEVSPNVLEIREAPSEANGWNVLRLHNGGDRPRRYFIIRYKEL